MKSVKFDKLSVEKDQKGAKHYYSPSDIHKALSCPPCPISMDIKDDNYKSDDSTTDAERGKIEDQI